MNLFARFLIPILGACFITFGSVFLYNLSKTNDLVVDSANEIAAAEGEKYALQIQAELNDAMDVSRTLAAMFASMLEEDQADRGLANAFLKKSLLENEQFLSVWTAWEPNTFDQQDAAFVFQEGHDETGRFVPNWSRVNDNIQLSALEKYDQPGLGDYYLLSKENGQEFILEPYTYPLQGQDVWLTSITAPITMNGNTIGVVGVNLGLDFLQEIANTIQLYDSGFGAIVTHQGTFAAHKGTNLIGASNYAVEGLTDAAAIQNAIESGQGLTMIDYSPVTDSKVFKTYTPIHVGEASTPWSLMVSIPVNEVKQESTKMLVFSICLGAVGTIILTLIIFVVVKRLIQPIKSVVVQMTEIAGGNLIVEPLELKTKDEIGQLAQAMNEMTSNIRSLIRDAADISHQVAAAGQELLASTNEMKDGIEQVSATSEELAAGSTDQAMRASDTLGKIQLIDQEVKQINEYAVEMNDRSQITEDSSQSGVDNAEQSINQMEMIAEKVTSTARIVDELGVKSKEIDQILHVINDIAAETNLLALNAAIEAARAGEQGKGFAVVAEEVRKLAEQSTQATNQIAGIINNVLHEVQEAETAMNEVVVEVQSGANVIGQNRQAFNEIAQHITEMIEQIRKVTDASKRIEQDTNESVQDVENIAAISQQSSAGAEELSATMEQQAQAMQEVDGMARTLAEMAESLNQSLAKFSY
ncbi:hypothetical protein BEP19_07455 [Ammoniphilus oxalaticus]|uniref:Chemotaxis protein n=1 Tax=Ammoniphilus oxalaticus TaxID=66863 RepID=A0A419SJN9_9BACL|nr:methyl-accepting chemotaxis protein [Ammoniphilus oxalaticus]RKD24233.1 hypothetical protein BEP19_07455 [Ammoniphilus oxalaticus]